MTEQVADMVREAAKSRGCDCSPVVQWHHYLPDHMACHPSIEHSDNCAYAIRKERVEMARYN